MSRKILTERSLSDGMLIGHIYNNDGQLSIDRCKKRCLVINKKPVKQTMYSMP